jgi:hypothetical protein
MSTLNVDKVDPSTGTALEIGTSGDTITVPSGATLAVAGTLNPSGTITAGTIAGTALADAAVTPDKSLGLSNINAKPFFINGDMQVAQRGTSFAQPDTNNDAFPVDRFSFQTGSIGVYTSTQEALTSGAAFNEGFKRAARIDCTTAVASPDAGDYFWFQYTAEAQDCLAWKKGTTSATVMTLSFWVKSNKTGTAQVNLRDIDNDRMVCALYTISSGDTWEQKVVTFPMETSNPMNNDNGTGFRFEWPLGGGSTYNSGTAPTAWEARVDADVAANSLDINDNTANDWAIAGIQAEVGTFTSTTLPPFKFESFGDNLVRCERYYQVISQKRGSSYENEVVPAVQYDSTQIYATYLFRTVMRTPPTLECASGTNYFRFYRNAGNDEFDDFLMDKSSIYSVSIYNGSDISGTGGEGGWTRFINNAPDDSLVALTGEL